MPRDTGINSTPFGKTSQPLKRCSGSVSSLRLLNEISMKGSPTEEGSSLTGILRARRDILNANAADAPRYAEVIAPAMIAVRFIQLIDQPP